MTDHGDEGVGAGLRTGAALLPACGAATPAEEAVQDEFGTRERAERFYRDQVTGELNARMQAFVARQEMVFISTADASGACDSSFRAGPPGFLHVFDERTVAYPEYRGNGVMASLANIGENPHIAMLLIDFFDDVIGLHINGRARIVSDDEMRAGHPELPTDPVRGRTPERWVVTDVHEAYIHCAKHIPRLARRGSDRAWGTDDPRRKGGDFFGVRAERSGR